MNRYGVEQCGICGFELFIYCNGFKNSTIRQRQQKLTLDVILLQVYSFQERDEVRSTFSCAILGSSQNIST